MRKVDSTGNETVVAGDGSAGYAGDGGPATSAALHHPDGIAVDAAGNVLIADTDNDRVRVVAATSGTFYGQAMTAGDIYTIAGRGTSGYAGDGGPATSAELYQPVGVALDASGNVLIADSGNSSIRVVASSTGTFYGRAMTAGDIYTIAGSGSAGSGSAGSVGDGGPATSADLDYPYGVAIDASGNVLIADTGNDRVRAVAASTGTFYDQSMTAGDIYTIGGGFADGGPATFSGPAAVAVDALGNVLVADRGNDRVRVAAASTGTFYGQAIRANTIDTIAGNGSYGYSGDGGAATSAELNDPSGVAVDTSDNVVVADSSNDRIRVVAARTGTFYGQSMTAGDSYTIAGNGTAGYDGDNVATGIELNDPTGVAVDASGNVLVADRDNHRVRVVAASTGTFYGQSMTAGDSYTIAGEYTGSYPNYTAGYSGDGGAATSAELAYPESVAVDASGNVLIADSGNNRVRVVAASTGTFYGQSMTAGDIYTIAGDGTVGYSGDGGAAVSAELAYPEGVAVDASGNVLIADTYNDRVRVVAASTGTFYSQAMTAGDIYTIAGGGGDYPGDGGVATSAGLYDPFDVAVDASGDVLVADSDSNRIRVVSTSTGTFYGQPMTAGDIYTIAGDGTGGYAGDGGVGTSAELDHPSGVAVDSLGNVLIADSGNSRIRQIAGYNSQAIAFTSNAPSDAFLGGSYTVSATGGASGNPVIFSSATPSVCTVSGSSVSFVGIGTCTVDANQAGNADYQTAAQVHQSFSITEVPQSITFTSTPPTSRIVGGPPYAVSATGGASGNTVTITIDSSSTGVCSLGADGHTVSFIGAGNCIIDANQAGNAFYAAAAQVQQMVSVYFTQTITFTSTPPSTAVPNGPPYSVSALGGGSGNPIVFSSATPTVCFVTGTTVRFGSAGQCTIEANQAGNALYTPAPQVEQNFVVGLVVTTTSLAGGFVGIRYSEDLAAANGNTPYRWTLVSGSLLAGLSLSSTGIVSGKPKTSGSSTFTVRVVDHRTSTHPQESATGTFTLTIALPVPVVKSVRPRSGPVTGGTKVVITGTSLWAPSLVMFGLYPATGVTVNAAGTQITAYSPAQGAGTVDIVVTTPGGSSATSSIDTYMYP